MAVELGDRVKSTHVGMGEKGTLYVRLVPQFELFSHQGLIMNAGDSLEGC